MDSVAQWFADHLGSFLAPEAVVFVVSMLPLIELRGGIPIAFLLNIPMWQAIPLAIAGNILPIPFILLFIKKIFSWLRPTKVLGGIVRKLEEKAANKSSALDKGEFIGLVLFVGIPLPGTGAWTGALIAALFGIDIKKASIAILLGVIIATVIVSFLSYGVLGQVVS